MGLPVLLAALTAVAAPTSRGCQRFLVTPGPEQGTADAALVRAASHHDTSPRSLGVAMASGAWRIVWAAPEGAEPGVFFFRGRPSAQRFVDVWGGPTSDRASAYRWAVGKVGAPPALARCFADRIVREGP